MRHTRHPLDGEGTTLPAVPMRPSRPARRRSMAAVLAFVLTVTLGVLVDPGAPAAEAAPRNSLTMTGTSSMRLGKTATLTISWRKAAKKPTGTVRFQAYTKGAWRTVKNVKVKNGKATVKVAPRSSTSYRAVVGSQRSAKKRVTVRTSWASFSFTKNLSTTIKPGASATGSISLFTNLKRNKGTVKVQRKSGTAWVTERTVKVPASGKATFTVSPKAATTYRLRWGSLSSYSRKVTVAKSRVSAIKAAPRNSLTVTGTSSMRLGKTATLKISWRKAAKKASGTVRFQAYTKGAWRTVKNVNVKKGTATVKVKPTTSTSYRALVGSQRSAKKRVTVRKSWASFSFTKNLNTTIKAGSSATGSVSLFTNLKLRKGTVTVMRKSGGVWVPVEKVTVPASGKTTFKVAPTKTTAYRLQWGSLVSYARKVTVERDWATLALTPTSLANKSTSATATVRWYAKGVPANGSAALERQSGSTWTKVADVPVANGTGTLSFVPGSSGTYRISAGGVVSASSKITVPTNATPPPNSSAIPKTFTFTGSGWGHGLGMSQYGAYAMARSGKSVEDILTHYYTDTAVSTEAVDRTISVQVLGPDANYSGSYDQEWSSTTLTVQGGSWRLRDAAGTNLTTGASTKNIMVKVSGTQVEASIDGKVVGKDSVVRLHWENTSYYNTSSTKTALANVLGAQGTYRHGRLTVRAVKDTDGKYYINVVNDLKLNTEYLYGIAEMPSSWGKFGQAALEAQAIAARNYAMTMTSTRNDCKCNLVDDIRDQMFTGWNKENEGSSAQFGKMWKKAVDATTSSSGTQGKVLRYVGSDAGYKGKLVTAYYSSSAGGATLNSEDAWAAKVPYLRSIKDPWSLNNLSGNPYTRWTATLSQKQARSFFGLADDIVRIQVQHYEGGGMKALIATSVSGKTATVSGKADWMRTTVNRVTTGTIRSAFVSKVTGS